MPIKINERLRRPDLQVNAILRLYDKASREDRSIGMSWYRTANQIARDMALEYDIHLSKSAGIISALSPGTKWEQNIIDAYALCEGLSQDRDIHDITVTTYGRNKYKAYDIYTEDFYHAEILNMLIGVSKTINKTSSFYLNILDPDEVARVTLDRHSIRVALNMPKLSSLGLTEFRYLVVQQAYIKASKRVGIMPNQMQAVTWIAFRRLNNI